MCLLMMVIFTLFTERVADLEKAFEDKVKNKEKGADKI